MLVSNWSQEKEYKDALDAFNDKNKEKVQLITKLMEVSFTNLCNESTIKIYVLVLVSDIAFVFGWVWTAGERKWKVEAEEAGGAE